MGDFASTYFKVAPGQKAYQFTGPAGNANDLLIRRATEGIDHTHSLRPPFSDEDLAVLMGTDDESQVIIVRDVEHLGEAEVSYVSGYLEQRKVKGQSLILTGQDAPEFDRKTKARIPITVDTADPTGVVGRKELEKWVVEHWQTTFQAAKIACTRTNYSVERLVWATRAFKALTSGKPTVGFQADKLAEACTTVAAQDQAHDLILAKSSAAPAFVEHLQPGQALGLLKHLESSLTDLMMMYPVLSTGVTTPKTVADKSGVHIVRVMQLIGIAPRYPPATVNKCRQALAFGFAHLEQPEVARVVAMMWG